MKPFVESIKERAEQVRGLLSGRARSRSEPIFYQACRIRVDDGVAERKYRVAIVVRARSCVEAECLAESHLRELIRNGGETFNGDVGIRWLKGRPLGSGVNIDETPTTLQLLTSLRRENLDVVSAVERVETPGLNRCES